MRPGGILTRVTVLEGETTPAMFPEIPASLPEAEMESGPPLMATVKGVVAVPIVPPAASVAHASTGTTAEPSTGPTATEAGGRRAAIASGVGGAESRPPTSLRVFSTTAVAYLFSASALS